MNNVDVTHQRRRREEYASCCHARPEQDNETTETTESFYVFFSCCLGEGIDVSVPAGLQPQQRVYERYRRLRHYGILLLLAHCRRHVPMNVRHNLVFLRKGNQTVV